MQGNAQHPAAFLAHHVFKPVGEKRAGGDQRAIIAAHPHEPAPPARSADGKAKFVILGQRIAGEGHSPKAIGSAAFGEFIERPARCRAAHACARQAGGKRIAHHHRLAMRFGEFLTIMAADVPRDPAAALLHQRFDRQLHKISPVRDGFIEQAKRGWIDHVLGIVEHHAGKAVAGAGFVGGHGGIEAIETIGFGAGAITIVDHQPQAHIAPRRRRRSRQRRRVIAIAPHIQAQVRLRPAIEHMADGCPDHRRFLPGRDQHRRMTMQAAILQRPARPSRGHGLSGRLQPDPHGIHREIIKRANQEKYPGEQQQFVLQQ